MISQQVDQFVELSSPCIVYAECSNTVQGEMQTPVNSRPKLTRDEIFSYASKISEIAKWCSDRGMPMAYHHHCLLYTSPSPRDQRGSRMPSSA